MDIFLNGVKLKEPDWARDMEKYLDIGELPVDKKESRKVRRRVAQFTKVDGIL